MKFTSLLSATTSIAALAVAGGLTGFTSIARAQAADQPQTGASAGLEEVVVTARRREEKIQTVPLAITAFSQKDLEEHRINQIQDLARAVPSLGTSRTGSDPNAPSAGQLNLRGLAGTVIYFAEVPIGSGDSATPFLPTHALGPGFYYDLDHVEVDKGPQGTLFGKNSIGGLISLNPKRPTNNFEGYIQGTLGNYNDREFEGAINIPIVDEKLLLRVAGQGQTRDGYTKVLTRPDDNLDGVNYQAWRVGITIRPTDDFENYFLYDGYWQHSSGSSSILHAIDLNHVLATVPIAPGLSLPVTVTGSGPLPNYASLGFLPTRVSLFPTLPAVLAQQLALGDRTQVSAFPAIGKDYFYGFTDNARWDISDDLAIKNIAAARVTKVLATANLSGTALPLLTEGDPMNPNGWSDNLAQYSEEMQLQGKSLNGKLTWVVGGYLDFFHPLGRTTTASEAVGSLSFANLHESSRSQAVFGQATYDLSDYVEGLSFTGGYRYTWDFLSLTEQAVKSANGVIRNPAGAPTNCVNTGADNNCVTGGNAHYNAPGWNVSLDEQLTPNTLIYIRSGNAYRPGGINGNVPPEFQQFKPEHVTDVEIGVKTDWTLWGISGRTNADLFHTSYKSIQVSQLTLVSDPNGGTPHASSIIRNSAGATLEGGELETTIEPFRGLTLSPYFSFIHSQYDQYPPTAGAVENPPFLYFPKIKYGVTTTYTLPFFDSSVGDISITAIYNFSGHQYDSNLIGEPYSIIPSYDQLDLRIDWANVFSQTIDASFFMTNATDNTYVTGAYAVYKQLGFESLVYSPPRMFGFTVKYRFGGGKEEAAAPTVAYTPPPIVAATPPHSYLVFFDFNKSDLTPQATQIVDQAAANAGRAKVTRLTLTGHTDTVGSDAYNMRLSRRRAESVASRLEKDGIPASEIEILAKGKRDLLVPTADGVREPQNRRVQIVYDGAAE
jgi:iron complex outermembrane receptor protein